MTSRPSIKLFLLLFLSLLLINLAWFNSIWLGWIFLIPVLVSAGALVGSYAWPEWNRSERILIGIGLVLTWIALLGSALFYVWRLGPLQIGIIAASLILTALLPQKRKLKEEEEIILRPSLGSAEGNLRLLVLVFGYGLLIAAVARMLAVSGTSDSIRTPWTELPPQFFLIVFLAFLALIGIVLNSKSKHGFALGLPLLFLIFSITIFVYPIGFGFDPFVHNATETYIAEYGTISPKPFSYIGQYALVLFFHHLANAPILFADRLLLPFFLILFAAPALRRGLQSGFRLSRKAATLGVLLLPIVPFSQWIVTTPQGFGNALALFSVSLLLVSGFKPSWPALLAALSALVTHPLAGIPALVFFGFCAINLAKNKLARSLPSILLFASASISLPALFWIYGRVSGLELFKNIDLAAAGSLFAKLIPKIGAKHVFWDDLTALYGELWVPLLIVISIIAAIFIKKSIKASLAAEKYTAKTVLLLLTALVTWLNAILLAGLVDFSYLPLAEQGGYAERLAGVGIIFLIPLGLTGIVAFIWRAKTLSPFLRLAAYSLIAGAVAASVYISYPHHDAYNIARGWSVGQADLAAVHFISADAGTRDYIVLANQSVSAAALREFGFKKYYNVCGADGACAESFYYPIPTGGPLYQYFHDASYGAPVRETILEAMDSAGVELGYFVVNGYWWKADKLTEKTKTEASAWQNFDGGAAHVFIFEK